MKAIPGTTLLMKNRAIIATHSGGRVAAVAWLTHMNIMTTPSSSSSPARLRLHLMSQSKRKEFSFC